MKPLIIALCAAMLTACVRGEVVQNSNPGQSMVVATEATLIRYEDKENGVLCYQPLGERGIACVIKPKERP